MGPWGTPRPSRSSFPGKLLRILKMLRNGRLKTERTMWNGQSEGVDHVRL